MAVMLMMFLLLALPTVPGVVWQRSQGSSHSFFWASGASDEKRHGHDAHDVPAVGACDGSGAAVAEVPSRVHRAPSFGPLQPSTYNPKS